MCGRSDEAMNTQGVWFWVVRTGNRITQFGELRAIPVLTMKAQGEAVNMMGGWGLGSCVMLEAGLLLCKESDYLEMTY